MFKKSESDLPYRLFYNSNLPDDLSFRLIDYFSVLIVCEVRLIEGVVVTKLVEHDACLTWDSKKSEANGEAQIAVSNAQAIPAPLARIAESPPTKSRSSERRGWSASCPASRAVQAVHLPEFSEKDKASYEHVATPHLLHRPAISNQRSRIIPAAENTCPHKKFWTHQGSLWHPLAAWVVQHARQPWKSRICSPAKRNWTAWPSSRPQKGQPEMQRTKEQHARSLKNIWTPTENFHHLYFIFIIANVYNWVAGTVLHIKPKLAYNHLLLNQNLVSKFSNKQKHKIFQK